MIEISKTDEDKFVQTIRVLQGMLDEADLSEYEALKTAIKSLRAWENVKEEMKQTRDMYSEFGISRSMDIIDKYMEVQDGKSNS